jgi:hypothetical protein
VLKEWAISFNPTHESLSHTKVWTILPNFPLVFWHEEVLTAIGNSISSFLDCEIEWEKKTDRRWLWLHVEVELKEGFLDEIELKCDEFRWVQHIDYWRVPLRCFGCHEVGHLKVQCCRPYS